MWKHWPLAPAPPPRLLTLAARALLLAFLVFLYYWVAAFLGGLAWLPLPEPVPGGDTVNTDKMFNVHIMAMALAFVAAAEAVVSYRAAGWAGGSGPPPCKRKRKLWHAALLASALVLMLVGLFAAFASHLLRVPPIVSLYSTHSFVGLIAAAFLAANAALGAWAYWWQRAAPPLRAALLPLHRWLGTAAFLFFVAAMALGIQEKQARGALGAFFLPPIISGVACVDAPS